MVILNVKPNNSVYGMDRYFRQAITQRVTIPKGKTILDYRIMLTGYRPIGLMPVRELSRTSPHLSRAGARMNKTSCRYNKILLYKQVKQ